MLALALVLFAQPSPPAVASGRGPGAGGGSGAAASEDAYPAQVDAWRRQREERLKAVGGWLSLAGLMWLKPGHNTFGADAANDVVLPPRSAPARAGTLVLSPSGRVSVEVEPGVAVTLAGKPITRAELRTDVDGGTPDVLALGELTLQIIDRRGRLAVRLKDANAEARRAFKGLAWYPVRAAYRVTARFTSYDKPRTIDVPSVLGGSDPMLSPGVATFELGGRTLHLEPVVEPGETQLFFILRDQTSGHSTYGAGRFLYADPAQDGRIVLDFNKAYSPPCAFTPYATCPLPPPGNRLPIAIEAGERSGAHPAR